LKSVVVKEVGKRTEEDKEVEKRRRHIVMYRVAEISMDNTEERKKGGLLFLKEMYSRGLGVEVEKKDMDQMYRIGRREEDKDRPFIVKFARGEKSRK